MVATNLGVSEVLFQFEFTNGFKMIHVAWSSIEEVPYRFFLSDTSNVKVTWHKISQILTRIEVSTLWHLLEFTDECEIMHEVLGSTEEALSVKFQSHMGQYIVSQSIQFQFWLKLGAFGL